MEQENEDHEINLGINTDTLIREVQKRTPIYDNSMRDYHDRNLKKKLWNEICQEVYSSSVWDSLSSEDKTECGKDIQKRWNSLRHCFRRELAAQKNTPSRSAAKKKKKYKYFDSLLFLVPFTEIVKTEGSIEDNDNEQSDLENRESMTSQAVVHKLSQGIHYTSYEKLSIHDDTVKQENQRVVLYIEENEDHGLNLGINLDTLIKEVQKRTPIYDTSRRDYHDRNLKKKLWNEIYQEVYSSSVWNSLSSEDKTKYGREIQKRWNSLRHSFRRELAAQKNMPSGSAAKKKRKYKYFDSLLFLVPFTEIVTTEGSDENEQSDSENRESMTSQAAPRFSRSRTANKNTDEKIIKVERKEGNQMHSQLKTCDSGQDEDELFLRSLTPYMKEFSKDQKLLLRLEMMKLILNYKQSFSNECNI